MALAPGYAKNLETVVRAAKDGRLAVLECQRRDTGKIVAVLVVISDDPEKEGGFVFSPFAEMFDSNPYELLNPPDPEGGFCVEKKEVQE